MELNESQKIILSWLKMQYGISMKGAHETYGTRPLVTIVIGHLTEDYLKGKLPDEVWNIYESWILNGATHEEEQVLETFIDWSKEQ